MQSAFCSETKYEPYKESEMERELQADYQTTIRHSGQGTEVT
jgi:hypothetical protein